MPNIEGRTGGSTAVRLPAAAAGIVLACLLWPTQRVASPPEHSLQLAERWLAAVQAGDRRGAIETARILAPEPHDVLSDPAFEKLARDSDLLLSAYCAPYDEEDYTVWRDALFFKTLACKVTREDRTDLHALQQAVFERMGLPGGRRASNPSPRNIWFGGAGSCDERSWLFASLAHQLGWNPEIVHLIDPKNQFSPHTICTVSRTGHNTWFADPLRNVLIPRTVESVGNDPELLQRIWPDHPLWHRSLKRARFWVPSLPQDYYPRNQRLYVALLPLLKDRCPRFGDPPQIRLAEARERHPEGTFVDLWYFPFLILRGERSLSGRSKP